MKRKTRYVIEFDNLMKDWDWDKNNELGLFPDKITSGSREKVFWKCSKGHSFAATISHKLAGRGCPYCVNRKVLKGYNDLATTHPNLAQEWDYEKNYPKKPYEFVRGSHERVYWICPKGHSYDMPILDRTQGNNCPICAGKRVVTGVNDLATTRPDLLDTWNWDRNNELGIFPTKITFGSTKKVWWKCHKCGYEWEVSPNSRTNIGTGCPCCSNNVVVRGINDLQTKFPEVAKRWHPTLNKINPWEITAFSEKEAYFFCKHDKRHIFKARISHVTKGEIVCPICANQKIIVGINDLQTTHPQLMKEWNWDKNNELGIFPTKITFGSTKKVWWKCSVCGYEWCASLASRTGSQHCGCPACKKHLGSSFQEKAIAYYLSKCFSIEENKKFDWLGNGELDIYIDELKIGVEYDGMPWHNDVERDIKKDNLCLTNGISLIRIREKSCPIYQSCSYKIQRKSFINKELSKCIQEMFDYISQTYNRPFEIEIDVEKDYIDILAKIATGKRDRSVASSELLKSWNYKKNGKISPENISLGSDRKVWWVCEKGHEWQATVSSRSGKGKCGCPYCAGQRVISGENDLATLYPQLVAEWDYSKNNKKPNEIKPMDNRKYWWICSKCGKSYQSSPSDRAGRGRGCPDCARAITIASHFKKVINLDTGIVYNSIKEASKQTGANATGISNCCRGKTKTAGGYRWKFFDE